MKEITAEQLKEKIDNEESFTLLDVRDAHEIYISDIEAEKLHIPYEELAVRLNEVPKENSIITFCRSGNTSGDACKLLTDSGFKDVASLKGGINEWAKKIDPTLPVY